MSNQHENMKETNNCNFLAKAQTHMAHSNTNWLNPVQDWPSPWMAPSLRIFVCQIT